MRDRGSTPPGPTNLVRDWSANGKVILVWSIAAVVGLAAFLIIASGSRFGFGAELPAISDATLTPGVIASTDQNEICGYVSGLSYSKRHRGTSEEMKAEVRQRYGMASCGEIDHRLPLSVGGADVVENLWCQSGAPVVWNYKLKDKLETLVWESVCKRHTMTLAYGQSVFLAPDWRVYYCSLIGGAPCPP